MIVVTGIAEIGADSIETIREAAREMAVATRTEDGCIVYAFYEDIEQPGRFRVYEEWETAEALRAHFATEHMVTFRAALADADVLKLDIKQFEHGAVIKVG